MSSEVVIEAQGLTKVFRVGLRGMRKKALDGLSLRVERGDLYGFLGPNGAGKSTTIKILMDLVRPDSGEIKVFGDDVSVAIHQGRVGYLPENPSYYPHFTGREILEDLASLRSMVRDRHDRVQEVLEIAGISHAADRKIGGYSKGMVQRLAFAQALLSDPDLLVLDEPASGLDPLGRYEMRNALASLVDAGKTVIFSTHIIADVELVASRVGIVHQGRLVREGTLEEILAGAPQRGHEVHGAVENVEVRAQLEALGECRWREDGRFVLVLAAEAEFEAVLSKILAVGARIREVRRIGAALEDVVVSSYTSSPRIGDAGAYKPESVGDDQ